MPESSSTAFGAMLHRFRRRALLTQEELAARTGLNARTIRRLESAELRRPRTATIRILAEHLELSDEEQDALIAAADPGGKRPNPGPQSRDRPPEAGPAAPAPRDELPADIVDFTGRAGLIEAMHSALSTDVPSAREGGAGRSRVIAVCGPPGVGKTTLAVRVAHLLRSHFPDGRLYLDMRGLADRPQTAAEALERLLRWCLPAESTVPDAVDERAALLRSTLAGRRVLVVLDNASTEAQVRPLLPASGTCAVLLTSRQPMTALDGLVQHDLGLFRSEEAIALLAQMLGDERVSAEPEAASTIVDLCGMLPLAVRIVGARLLGRPHWSLRHMVDQLADEHRRLDVLAISDRGVRSSVGLSYRTLGPAAGRLLRLLGACTESDIPAWVAAALLDVAQPEAEDLLEDLVDARLVEAYPAGRASGNRYSIHALVRLYARERCAAEDTRADQMAAAQRMVSGWLFLAEQSETRLPGGLPRVGTGSSPRRSIPVEPPADPMQWFETERLALSAAIKTACAFGLDESAWELTGCLSRFLEVGGHFELWHSVLEDVLDAVRAAGNRRGEAHLLRAMAELGADLDEYDKALEDLNTALGIFDDLGEQRAAAHTQRAIGVLERIRGDTGAAGERFERALVVFTTTDDTVGIAETLFSLGALRRDQGSLAEALTCFERALALEVRLGNLFNLSLLLCSIGSTLLAQRSVERARTVLTRALDLAQEIRQGDGYALTFLGEADIAADDLLAAAEHLDAALTLFRTAGDRYGEAVTLRNLGELHRVQGRLDEAMTDLEQALALWGSRAAPRWQARTLVVLGRLQLTRNEPAAARSAWETARALFSRLQSAEQDEGAPLR